MSTRVIYSQMFSEESKYIVDELCNSHDWQPVCFHSVSKVFNTFSYSYPDALVVDSLELRRGSFDLANIGPIVPVDEDILNKLSQYESTYMNWLQDSTGWNFSYAQRRRYYCDILSYWNTVIHNLEPDVFVSYQWPHHPSDYALYLLCKHYYSIPVLFLDVTPYLDQNYFTIGVSIEDLSESLVEYYHSNRQEKVSAAVSGYLDGLQSSGAVMPQHVSKYFSYLGSRNKDIVIRYLRLFLSVLIRGMSRRSDSPFKMNKKPMGDSGSAPTLFQDLVFKVTEYIRNNKLRSQYNSYCVSPGQLDKYIYFAAGYQPEAISNLMPGVYEDPLLILDILANSIPDDWCVYYREHPHVFIDLEKGVLQRNEYYYERINSYKNVKIISTSINTFELIDNSIAVATSGGTVGWEAMVRGVPALLFGRMWYKPCKSVLSIREYSDAIEAVSLLEDGYKPDASDIERYAQSIYLACEQNLLVPSYSKEQALGHGEMRQEMQRIAEFIYRRYQDYYIN